MTIQGFDKLDRKLKKLENIDRELRRPMEESLALLQDDLATAPRKKKGAFTRHATPGQRRAYWYLVKKGKIDHLPGIGYKRGGSAKAWTTKIERISNGIRGVVGNVKSHMRFVQGDEQQSFHKESGWRTTDEALERNSKKILGKFRNGVKVVLSK